MDPVTLTTERLLLRTVGAQDADAVYAAAQDPDIQRWTTIPSPYLREHAEGFVGQLAPDGWADASMFTFGVFLPAGLWWACSASRCAHWASPRWASGRRRSTGGTATSREATLGASRWAFIRLSVDRVEWRAEVGNAGSRAVAERAGFTIEGVLRSAINNKGVRRDCWVGSLLPSDLGLPSTAPYLPAPARTP